MNQMLPYSVADPDLRYPAKPPSPPPDGARRRSRTGRRHDRPPRCGARLHPLRPAWAWRARLDAIRRQAAVDGKAIDPWHLAALIEGVRLRLDHTPALIDRGMLFAAAHHAFELYRWFAMPDETQRAAIARAADHLETVGNAHSPLLGAAFGVHAWLDRGGERPPTARRPRVILAAPRGDRPALPAVDRCRGTRRRHSVGARRLDRAFPRRRSPTRPRTGWRCCAASSATGLPRARAVAGRRRDSHAAAAIDILAAAPLVSATSLGQALGIATKNATRLLDGFVVLGIVSEVTHRSKRRLYGLKHWPRCARPPHRRAGRSRGAGRAGRVRCRLTLSSGIVKRYRWS